MTARGHAESDEGHELRVTPNELSMTGMRGTDGQVMSLPIRDVRKYNMADTPGVAAPDEERR